MLRWRNVITNFTTKQLSWQRKSGGKKRFLESPRSKLHEKIIQLITHVITTDSLLDHLKEEIESRFPSEMCNLYNGFYVIPSIFLHCKDVCWKTEFLKFLSAYKDDMPNYRTIHCELEMWETSWRKGFEKVEYDSVSDTLKNCDELAFPNIYVALKILFLLFVG